MRNKYINLTSYLGERERALYTYSAYTTAKSTTKILKCNKFIQKFNTNTHIHTYKL